MGSLALSPHFLRGIDPGPAFRHMHRKSPIYSLPSDECNPPSSAGGAGVVLIEKKKKGGGRELLGVHLVCDVD